MGFNIEDSATGITVKVGRTLGNNRIYTTALLVFPIEEFSHHGLVYSVPTDYIALTTTASFSGILYITATSTERFTHIESIRTSSTVNCAWKAIKNATTGTLISGGTAITAVNNNFSSGKTYLGTIKKGADALTITNGTHYAQWPTSPYNAFERIYQGSLILNTGNSLAILAQPTAAGNVGVTITMWEELPSDMGD